MTKTKIHTLSSLTHANSRVYGIATSNNEIQFCTYVNAELQIDLKVSEQVEFKINPQKTIKYSIYSYYDELRMMNFELVSNVTKHGVIIGFLDSISFFLRCSSEYIKDEENDLYTRLKNIDSVLFVQKIEDGNYSQKQRTILRRLFPYI